MPRRPRNVRGRRIDAAVDAPFQETIQIPLGDAHTMTSRAISIPGSTAIDVTDSGDTTPDPETNAVKGSLDFLAGGGEMGARIRAYDWGATPLGPPETWPQGLRSAVSILLPSRTQIVLFWGPELVTLYNDAYAPVFGAKHPSALGLPARECWSEVWHILRPLFEGVVTTGQAFWAKDLPLLIHRQGFLEETYFDVSYDPVRVEDGSVGGIFCIVSEQTGRVVGERRLRALRELGTKMADAKSAEEVCRAAAAALAMDPADVPMSLLYLTDGSGLRAELAGIAGVAPDDVVSGCHMVTAGMTALASAAGGEASEVETGVFFNRAPETAGDRVLVLSISSGTQVVGALVAGVSRHLRLAGDYRDFFDLAAASISAEIVNARAYAEERKRAEALAEIDRAKTAFFSNVSHEFRTPLTLLLGPVEDLLANPPVEVAAENRELLEVVHRNGLRLQKLVNTLLDFSRIEAGRVHAVYEPTDLGALTSHIASNFRSACERAGLRLTTDCVAVSEPVHVDREMWEKVVLNLVSNAFKFTFDGEIAVMLRPADDAVELVVHDTGIGIPSEELPHIFERFHRVKGARGRTHEGTGIGLALVQELVKLHGGSIRAESEPGKGSTFIVAIPKGAAHLPADRIGASRGQASTALGSSPFVEEALRWLPESDSSMPASTQQSGETALASSDVPSELPDAATHREAGDQRARILWADDNADMRDYVRGLLSPQYDVVAVGDGKAALAAARAHPPDLILADVMMPQLDGFELLRELRADAATRAIPVIMLSARAGEEARIEGLRAGADDYVVKPFSARELVARIAARLELDALARRFEDERAAILNDAVHAREEFLAIASHELRNPVNALQLQLVALMLAIEKNDRPVTSAWASDRVRHAVAASRRLTDLVETLLDVSRITAGRLDLEPEEIDFGQSIHTVLEGFKDLLTNRQVVTRVARVTGSWDRLRLEQIVTNLLSNAIKYGEGRPIEISLEGDDAIASLAVTDHGIGIGAEDQARLFERFERAVSRRHYGGFGLGLWITRQLVHAMGGQISVQSRPGEGSTFHVMLPRAGIDATTDRSMPRGGEDAQC